MNESEVKKESDTDTDKKLGTVDGEEIKEEDTEKKNN